MTHARTPIPSRIEARLLDADKQQLCPEISDALPWAQTNSRCDEPGSRIFRQQVAGAAGVHAIDMPAGELEARETQCFVSLPSCGDFYLEAVLIKVLPGAMRCQIKDGPCMALALEERNPVIRIKVRPSTRVMGARVAAGFDARSPSCSTSFRLLRSPPRTLHPTCHPRGSACFQRLRCTGARSARS